MAHPFGATGKTLRHAKQGKATSAYSQSFSIRTVNNPVSTDRIIEQLRASKDEIAQAYHAKVVAVFGSYARQDQHEKSDLDLLYEVIDRDKFGFLEACGLEEYILSQLSVPSVDLVDKDYLNPVVQLEIQKDLLYV